MCTSVPLKATMAGLFALITGVAVIVAFVPTTVTGINSHKKTATSLHQRTTEYVQRSIAALLTPPPNLYTAMRLLQAEGAIGADVFMASPVTNTTDDRARQLLAKVKGLTRTSAGLLVSRVFAYAPAVSRYYGAGDQGEGTPITTYTTVENGTYNYVTNSSGDYFTSYTSYLDMPYIASLDEIQMAVNTTIDSSVVCSNRLVLGFLGVAISCAYRTPDPRLSGAYLYSGIVLEASFLVTLLKGINRLTANTKIALAHGTSKQVMALSYGEDTQIKLPGWADESLPTSQRFATKLLSEITDPTMSAAIRSLGGQDALGGLSLPFFESSHIGGKTVYVDVSEFNDAQVGLRLFIILVVPESDFLGDLTRTTNITVGCVCALFVVLIAIGVLFAHFLVQPLEALGDRMQLTATFQDDGENGSLSTMTEIKRLQISYTTMRDHLNAMKSYLPQSVLQSLIAGNATTDEDEREDMDDSNADLSRSHLTSPRLNGSSLSVSGDTRSKVSADLGHSKIVTDVSAADSGSKRNIPSNLSVSVKVVSVLSLNVRKTHAAWGGSSTGGAVLGLQQSFLTTLLKHANTQRGTVDTFQGDRVLISFNAVRNVAAHGRKAATTGYDIIQDMGAYGVGVTGGLSSGRALVGNMGVDGMMKFNIISPAVGEAVSLERCARIMTEPNPFLDPNELSPTGMAIAATFPHSTPLFTHSGTQVLSEVQGSFLVQPVELAWRRGASATAKRERVIVLSIHRHLVSEGGGDSEWMYELEKQVCNPCISLLEAYVHIIADEVNEARLISTAGAPADTEDLDSPDVVAVSEVREHLRKVLDSSNPCYAGWWL